MEHVRELGGSCKLGLLIPYMSRVEEDDSIIDGCVERYVEDEEAPVVPRRQRTSITCWNNFYSLPRKGKTISKDGRDSTIPGLP